jgi:hypothetical protein
MFDHGYFPAFGEILRLRGDAALETAGRILLGVALTCPVLFYLLARLRNAAVALLCLVPFFVEWLAVAFGSAPSSRAPFTLAAVLSILLVFLGARLGRFRRPELAALVGAILFSTAGAWLFFSQSPRTEEHALARLATGDTASLATFCDERRLATRLADSGILLDEECGSAFITILNSPQPFILAYESRWRFLLNNPQAGARSLLMRQGAVARDAVAATFVSLGTAKKSAFREVAAAGPWVLLSSAQPLPLP